MPTSTFTTTASTQLRFNTAFIAHDFQTIYSKWQLVHLCLWIYIYIYVCRHAFVTSSIGQFQFNIAKGRSSFNNNSMLLCLWAERSERYVEGKMFWNQFVRVCIFLYSCPYTFIHILTCTYLHAAYWNMQFELKRSQFWPLSSWHIFHHFSGNFQIADLKN